MGNHLSNVRYSLRAPIDAVTAVNAAFAEKGYGPETLTVHLGPEASEGAGYAETHTHTGASMPLDPYADAGDQTVGEWLVALTVQIPGFEYQQAPAGMSALAAFRLWIESAGLYRVVYPEEA